MMAFPIMLVEAAERAGMPVPSDVDNFDPNEYPHFHVFCRLQLGKRIRWGEHWDNAKVIASIGFDRIKTMHLEDFIAAGFEY